MSDFRRLRLSGMDALRAAHPDFGSLQERYNIPGEFCMPEERNNLIITSCTTKDAPRCMTSFYNMLSIYNPCFVDRRARRANGESLAVQEEPTQSLRPEPPPETDNEIRAIPPALFPLTEQPKPKATSNHQAFRLTKKDPKYNPDVMHQQRSVNPAYNPFIHASAQPQRQDAISFRSTNPSNLNQDQRDAAEKAEARRSAPKRNAPIPEDEDSTNTDGETSWLYESKLLPAQKSQILKLKTAIKRIKSKVYDLRYMREKDKAIAAAESDRLRGLSGPHYSAGVEVYD
jgi:hypothetical protein